MQGVSVYHEDMAPYKYTKEALEEAVRNSTSYAGVLRYLGLRQAGGTQSLISLRVKEYGIPTPHFKGKSWNKGLTGLSHKKPLDKILVELPEGSRRTKRSVLLDAMIESGISYLCNSCSQGDIWNCDRLTLEINHKDGNWLNNRLANLEFLCPNCHSQQWHENRPHKYR